MRPDPVAPGETIDWNEIWKQRQTLQDSSRHFDDPSHNWNKRENAERYDGNSRSKYDSRVSLTIAGMELSRQSKVLDIGAGPGTLAVPLSPLVKEITAVEPGAGMAEILLEHTRKNGLANISCIQKRWEDIDPALDLSGPYDIVIASLSLTMYDIRAALEKMDAVSSHYVYLYWFVDMAFWERMSVDLWVPLFGHPYFAGPKTDCLWNVLYQMGIYANVEILPLTKEYRFSSREELNSFFRKRFNVTTPEQETILDRYIAPLVRVEGLEFVISGDSHFAKIWWDKQRP